MEQALQGSWRADQDAQRLHCASDTRAAAETDKLDQTIRECRVRRREERVNQVPIWSAIIISQVWLATDHWWMAAGWIFLAGMMFLVEKFFPAAKEKP
jgi:hypothetical protein